MTIIAKLSFSIKKEFEQFIRDAMDQFKKQDYADKLKTCITYKSMPADKKALCAFLYDQVTHV
jgi:hypothetical protein